MARVSCLEFKPDCGLPGCGCQSCANCGFLREDHEEVTYEVDRCVDRVIVHLRPGQPVELRNEQNEVVLVAHPRSDGTMRVGVASEPYNDDDCDEGADGDVMMADIRRRTCDRSVDEELPDMCDECGGPLACPHGVNPEDKCDVCDFACDGSGVCRVVEDDNFDGCDENTCGNCGDCPPACPFCSVNHYL